MPGTTRRSIALWGGGALIAVLAVLLLHQALNRRHVMVPTPNVTANPWPEDRKARVRMACMRQWGGRGRMGWLNQCLNQVPRDFAW